MKIKVIQAESEEQLAVTTARTSRSSNTFDTILDEVKERGHVEFIEKNVLGYGHDSVAEMAQCPAVGIEDISDIAGNVIATSDPQLVVQMTSTRYQDMANRKAYDYLGNVSGAGEEMKAYYMEAMKVIGRLLEDTDHPRKRTLQCDIARSFLPAGISTQLAIRGNARVMRDAINFMLGHDLGEVRLAGSQILDETKGYVEVLLDRHIVAAESSLPERQGSRFLHGAPGFANFKNLHVLQEDPESHLFELKAWRDSGWRRRMRLASAPTGPYLSADISSDWGAYRDLKRNRTLIQDDVLPDPQALPDDALWAFRELYPDVCRRIDSGGFGDHSFSNDSDPYLAPMGSIVSWRASGHILNWAYALRLRSGPGCHPAYAIPIRKLMHQILMEDELTADAMGLVESPKSLCGVEFRDRVPS